MLAVIFGRSKLFSQQKYCEKKSWAMRLEFLHSSDDRRTPIAEARTKIRTT